ncbi:RICIN domain-containing protein [Streptomyces sp. NRRL S-87]|uniref:RICIN domain-containing protein n=1 Tax=Streptomyces sp. NRRL S-87 TaxID=1463920 RepID=UPI0005690655|nr:RICIN domain-containing protein [Streptomyces sp. NRRL S-87]
MARTGRPQGAMKGATSAANELAAFLLEMTDGLTVRELAGRYGGGRTLWSEYRSGARIVPFGRLGTVIRDRVRDARGRDTVLERARRLHDAALAAEAASAPEPSVDAALRQAEADLAESARLVKTLLAVITVLHDRTGAGQPAGPVPDGEVPVAPNAPDGGAAAGHDATAPAGPHAGVREDPDSGTGTGSDAGRPAEPVPVTVDLAAAVGELGSACAVRAAAREALAQAHLRAADHGHDAGAGPELTLALVRVGSELELHREGVRRLHAVARRGIRTGDRGADPLGDRGADPLGDRAGAAGHGPVPDRWDGRQVPDGWDEEVLEGVVLERMDHAPAAAPPAAVGRGGPAAELAPVHPGGAVAISGAGRPGADRRSTAPVALLAVTGALLLVAAALGGALVGGLLTGRGQSAAPVATGGPGVGSGGPAPGTPPPTATGPSTVPGPTPTAAAPTTGRPTTGALPPTPAAPRSPGPVPPSGASTPPRPSASPSASPSPTPSPTDGTPPLPTGPLRLTNAASDMCLSAPRGNDVPSVGVVQNHCGAGAEQFWQLTLEATGPSGPVYAVRNRHNGLCLSVDAASTADDAVVTQFLCGDEGGLFRDQFWTFRYSPRFRAWHLASRNSGKCVTVRSGGGESEQARQGGCVEEPWVLWRA